MPQFHSSLILSAVLACSIVGGCASTPPASSRADVTSINSVETGQKALVLMANSGQPCEKSTFEFQNVISEEVVEMKIVQLGRSYGFSIGQPAMVTMPPGTYKIISGNCANRQYVTIGYSDIEKWFEPFTVQGGDVRFLGNLQVSAAKGEGRQALIDNVVGRMMNMGLSTNKPTDYIVLNVVDAPSRSKSALQITYPDLAERFKSAPLDANIDAKAFRKVVRDAYAPDENGKAPLNSEAHKIVRTYIDSFE